MKRLFTYISLAGLLAGPGCLNGNNKNNPDIPEDELPQRYAELVCQFLEDCGCSSYTFPDQASCVTTVSTGVSTESMQATAFGLTYDASCGGDLVAGVEDQGCSNTYENSDSCSVCKIYYGGVAEGQPCTFDTVSSMDDCAQGLYCNTPDGGMTFVCEDPCATNDYLGLDEPCWDAMNFEILGICDYDANLYCDTITTNSCQPAAGSGASCANGVQCQSGLYCDMSDVMAPVCATAPAAGEPCPGFVCQLGSQCDTTTDPMNPVCVANEANVCFLGP